MLMNMVGISSCIAGDQVSNVNSAKKVHLPFLCCALQRYAVHIECSGCAEV